MLSFPRAIIIYGCALLVYCCHVSRAAFQSAQPLCLCSHHRCAERTPQTTTLVYNNKGNFLGDLWEEIIEFSTLGPSERKMLAERRRKQKEQSDEPTEEAFRAAKQKYDNTDETESDSFATSSDDVDDMSLDAFNAAVAVTEDAPNLDMDGYGLRDLLLEKWKVPLDVDFQRQPGGIVYCTILPVAFGSKLCRHESELEYCMHLQGILEILHKYNNLELFVAFIKSTDKNPKVGTDSVPFRLQLSEEQLKKIL